MLAYQKALEAIKACLSYLKGTINIGLLVSERQRYVTNSFMQMRIMLGCQDSRRSTVGSAQFHEIDWLDGHQISKVDEQWFDLSADLLRKALAITPVIPAHPFELPPSGNTVIDFVNELGYPEPLLDWKDVLGKLYGRVYSRDPDIFLTQSKSQNQSEEPKEECILSSSFLMTVFQGDNILPWQANKHPSRPELLVHHTGDDYVLGNSSLVPIGEAMSVWIAFPIPDNEAIHIPLRKENPISNLLTKMMKLNKNLFLMKKVHDTDLDRDRRYGLEALQGKERKENGDDVIGMSY
ncbi:hypothetical protein Tco_1113037 [Tanacetum coccineum]|uniref:Uncharacterized protein n=1 Tax=Tanacetum coccineum TaxID=301880 RepID=A0ABQ5IUQ6_9ASTR